MLLTTTKLKQCLPSPKSHVLSDLTANVIYKITCSSCTRSYVGKTERYLKTRLKEHKRHPSSVYNHTLECGGDTAVTVLAKDNKSFKLAIKEAICIRKEKPALNNRNKLGYLLSLSLI